MCKPTQTCANQHEPTPTQCKPTQTSANQCKLNVNQRKMICVEFALVCAEFALVYVYSRWFAHFSDTHPKMHKNEVENEIVIFDESLQN